MIQNLPYFQKIWDQQKTLKIWILVFGQKLNFWKVLFGEIWVVENLDLENFEQVEIWIFGNFEFGASLDKN